MSDLLGGRHVVSPVGDRHARLRDVATAWRPTVAGSAVLLGAQVPTPGHASEHSGTVPVPAEQPTV